MVPVTEKKTKKKKKSTSKDKQMRVVTIGKLGFGFQERVEGFR